MPSEGGEKKNRYIYKPLIEALLGGKITSDEWNNEPVDHIDWRCIQRQLQDLVADHRQQPLSSLIQKIRQATQDDRFDWIEKLKLWQQNQAWNKEFLELLGEGQSEDFKIYLFRLPTDKVMALMDDIMTDMMWKLHKHRTTAEEGALALLFGWLVARLLGFQGQSLVEVFRLASIQRRQKVLHYPLLQIRREMMTPAELETIESWRKSALVNAPDHIQLYFRSLPGPVQHNILFDAVLAVAEPADKELLCSKRGSGLLKGETWELDFFVAENADNKFIERVASMVVVGTMKAKARGDSGGIAEPLGNKCDEDKELLLTIMRYASSKEKEFIRNMTPDQVNDVLEKLQECFLSKVSDDMRLQISALSNAISRSGSNMDPMKKEALEGLAKKDDVCKALSEVSLLGGHRLFFDKNLKKKYREEKKKMKQDIERNPTLKCTGCGNSIPSKNAKQCGHCRSVWYCSRDCQVKDWNKGSHKKACKALASARVKASQPDVGPEHFRQIPRVCLALPPCLTCFDTEVCVALPLWDLQDRKYCDYVQKELKHAICHIAQDVKNFFKLEHLGAETSSVMVGNMCHDALSLYLLGYKDSNGNSIQLIPTGELLNGKVANAYHHYTQVPKGWQIPAENRPFIPPDVLAALEKGIEGCRKLLGEREAI